MKKLLLILLILPFSLYAQNYSGEVKVPGKDAALLFSKAQEWFSENHKSADNVPPVEDIPNRKIKGNGNFTFIIYTNELAVNIITSYAITVSVNNGLYNYAFENIMIEHGRKFPLSSYKNGMTREGTIEMFQMGGVKAPSKKMIESNMDYNTKVFEQFEANIDRVITSLEDKMKE